MDMNEKEKNRARERQNKKRKFSCLFIMFYDQ